MSKITYEDLVEYYKEFGEDVTKRIAAHVLNLLSERIPEMTLEDLQALKVALKPDDTGIVISVTSGLKVTVFPENFRKKEE